MKYLEFYRQRIQNLPSPNEKGDVLVPCVFHVDRDSASLGINVIDGRWHCFAPHCPGHKGGGYRKFDDLLSGNVPGFQPVGIAPIDPAVVEGFHNILLGSPTHLEFLEKVRGLTRETITRFKLGWDSDRYWIPIRDADGKFVNVRKYKPGAKADKVVSYGPGYGTIRLWPVPLDSEDWVLLTEGETDALVARQHGLPASTTTGGSGAWKKEFSDKLRGKLVVISYDADSAGKRGATSLAEHLVGIAREVRILRLPLRGTADEKDLTDYFVKLRHTRTDFDVLLAAAELVLPPAPKIEPADGDILDLHLSDVGRHNYVGRRIRSTVLIAGKDLAPFQVPKKLKYKCEMGEKYCVRCGIGRCDGELVVDVPEFSADFLRMVNTPQEKLDIVVSELAHVPNKCRKYKMAVEEYANVESIKAIPEIDFNNSHHEYVIRNLFYLGHGLQTNRTYQITAVVMPEPKTQYATALISDAKSAQDTIEKFQLTDELMKMLEIFRA